MRAALAARGGAGVIVRIIHGQHEAPRVLVDRVRGRFVADIRNRKQARDVGVVHQVVVPDAVDLVRIHVTVLVRIYDSVVVDAGADSVAHFRRLRTHPVVVPDVCFEIGQIGKRDHRKHIIGHVVAVLRRVVARPETRPHHAGVANGRTFARIGERAVPIVRKGVVALEFHDAERAFVCALHLGRERCAVAGALPVRPCEPDRIRERVEFELLFSDLVVAVECVGVRVDEQIFGLARDDAAQHGFHGGVIGEVDVWTHLGTGVA